MHQGFIIVAPMVKIKALVFQQGRVWKVVIQLVWGNFGSNKLEMFLLKYHLGLPQLVVIKLEVVMPLVGHSTRIWNNWVRLVAVHGVSQRTRNLNRSKAFIFLLIKFHARGWRHRPQHICWYILQTRMHLVRAKVWILWRHWWFRMAIAASRRCVTEGNVLRWCRSDWCLGARGWRADRWLWQARLAWLVGRLKFFVMQLLLLQLQLSHLAGQIVFYQLLVVIVDNVFDVAADVARTWWHMSKIFTIIILVTGMVYFNKNGRNLSKLQFISLKILKILLSKR